MKQTKYRIMEITDGHDSKFGKVWIIKANPAIVNEIVGTASTMSDIYEGSETFITPYDDNDHVVSEIELFAKNNKLWIPEPNEWITETALDEKDKKRKTIHRYTDPSKKEPNIIITDKKPLKQYVIKQNKDVCIYQSTESGKMMFLCGNTKGFVSPAAAEKIVDYCCPIDNFVFGMVAKKGEAAVPCIMWVPNKK